MKPEPLLGRIAFSLLITAIFIHFGFGFLLNLSVDEAHYALYAAKLDWSYFDHPPMVGWIQAVPVALNAPDGMLRLIPELLWIATVFLIRRNTEKMIQAFGLFTDARTIEVAKNWSTLCVVSAPILHVLGVGLLPDTLLIFLVTALSFVALQIRECIQNNSQKDGVWWILLGCLFGLSGLSKYTAIFFAIAIAICLIAWNGLKVFKRPYLWIGLVLAAILISPILYWNQQHEWISFIYQIKHGSGGEWQARRLGVFVLNQIVTYGLLPLVGLWLCIKNKGLCDYWLTSLFILPFLIFAYLSGGGGSLPHWTSPAWVALIPISSYGLSLAWQKHQTKLTSSLLYLQLFLCLTGFILLWSGGIPSISKDDPLGKKNPIADLYGWQEAGSHAKQLAKTHHIDRLAVANWTLGSRLAWYARPLSVHILDQRFDQFDLWFGNPPKNSHAIVVNWSNMSFPTPTQKGQYQDCKSLDRLPVSRHGRVISEFEFMLCKDWQTEISVSSSSLQAK